MTKNNLPIRFDRNELGGAFGDIGTDIPLIVLLILTCNLDARSVLILFGACQVFAGLAYRLPIPVQPLKAMAIIAIADNLSGDILVGGGLAIGVIMAVLSLSGGLGWIARIVPKVVVRGIQFGLGIKLALLALQRCLPDEKIEELDRMEEFVQGVEGYILGAVAFVIIILLRNSRKYPAALFVLAFGIFYVIGLKWDWTALKVNLDVGLPVVRLPSLEHVFTGFVVLAIPQLPLSLGNAVLATRQTVGDLFPGQDVPVRKLGVTYSICNLVAPLFGGVPVCHGSGGVAGHYAFGARTGGSAIIYGATFLICGLAFSQGFFSMIVAFPKAILGMLLLFEAIALMLLTRDMAANLHNYFLVIMVGLIACGLPYGFCIGILVGTALYYWDNWRKGRETMKAGSPLRAFFSGS